MADVIEVSGSDTSTPLNLRKRVDLVARWIDLPRSRVLDAGCGAGEYVAEMCARGAQAEGIEYMADKVAEWNARRPGDPRVRRGDLAAIDFRDATFDGALLNEVIEHVPDDNLALRELHRVLKPGGTLVIFSPNRYYPFETHGAFPRKGGANIGIPKTFLLPYLPLSLSERIVRFDSRNYWPSTLARMTRQAGFDIVHHGFVWQTFERLSCGGTALRVAAPVVRKLCQIAERLPFIRRFGISQVIVARRPG